jgi:large subunit ribosomal protein L21
MYAVIQTGGKQYRVEPGKTVVVEKLDGEQGTAVVFDQVLLVSSGDGGSVSIGKPTVTGAKVTGSIVEQGRGEKLVVFKFRRRKNYVRKNGHRQDYTAVKIAEIQAS